MTGFAAELRRLRRRHGYSQERLAARAGLSPEAVSLLERGKRSPRMTTLRLLADALGLDDTDRNALFDTVTDAVPADRGPPAFVTPLVGRDADLHALATLLTPTDVRLVTLLGPSGVGKTRLAVAYSTEAAADYPHGVYWLPVGSITDRASLLPALAGVLGVRISPTSDLTEVLDHLRPLEALLVIENAEHHIEAVTRFCRAVLAAAPGITVMVTSRHLLWLAEERAYVVEPLSLEGDGSGPPPATALFLSRAGRGAELGPDDAAAVERICRRVDGLPLALELAAARTDVLTLPELADTLERELGILHTAGPDGAQSLAGAMVEWSYRGLNPAHQQLFEQLSIFAATFDRAGAQAVAGLDGGEIAVLDGLSALAASSLVIRSDDGAREAHFRMLQLIRAYAAERLAERGQQEATAQRHARHIANLIQQAAPHLTTAAQQEWSRRLDRLLPDIRRAMAYALRAEPEAALHMVDALSRWCYLHGRYAEGRSWAAAALAAAPDAPPALRAAALASGGLLAFLQCDYAQARPMITEARELYAELGDATKLAWATARLGAIAREQGDYDRADRLHRDAMAMAEEVDDEREAAAQLNFLCFLTWLRGQPETAEPLGREALARLRAVGDAEGVIWALMNLGAAARYRGELDAAEVLLGQARDRSSDLSFREGVAWALNQLGAVARLKGQLDRADALQRVSLAGHRELGDRWRAATGHDELAAVALAAGDPERAAAELGRADRLRAEIDAPVPGVERAEREATVAGTRAALGAAYEAARLSG